MIKYPVAVKEKAQRMEKLLQYIAAGEGLSTACAETGIPVNEKRLNTLQAKYEAGGRTLAKCLRGVKN